MATLGSNPGMALIRELGLDARPRIALMREWASTYDPARWPVPPVGRDRPVMLIPGFLAGDPSLAPMARWLRAGGWSTVRPGVRWNVDCMEATLGRLERQLEAGVERVGQPALLVGQSRGGAMARVLATRRPDLVETLVTLGSPVLNQLAVYTPTLLSVGTIGFLGTVGVPGLFGLSCLRGDCCTQAKADLAAPFPEEVRYLAVFSRADEIVRWHVCVEPAATAIEVHSSHLGMGVHADVWRELARAL
jgi:pimeloyl-ACP methyl ester carboxylesterase